MGGWCAACHIDDCSSHDTATFHSRLGVLGLSVRRFAAMTGVQYETARHWGVVRHGHPEEFPRWVPLMLEMMDPSVSRKPPNEAVYRLRPRSNDARHHIGQSGRSCRHARSFTGSNLSPAVGTQPRTAWTTPTKHPPIQRLLGAHAARRLLAAIQHDTATGEQEEWTHKFRYRHRVSPEILVR